MTCVTAPVTSPPALPALPAAPANVQRHLFGAIGTPTDATLLEAQRERERARAEATRVSGNFYVDRMVVNMRTR